MTHQMTFKREQWTRVAAHIKATNPLMADCLLASCAIFSPWTPVVFEVSKEERETLRQAASALGIYQELGIQDPTKETQDPAPDARQED